MAGSAESASTSSRRTGFRSCLSLLFRPGREGTTRSFVTVFVGLLCASCRPKGDEKTGLALWSEVDLDLRHLKHKRCSECGAPATSATRDLETHLRAFHCDAHRGER